MRFQYCPHCGKKAELKEIGDEGLIPYCAQCKLPLWDMFTTSVIAAVVRRICGGDGGTRDWVNVKSVEYVGSYPYEKKEMLMLGFKAVAERKEFTLSGEVDSAEWVKLEDALGLLREGGIAWQLVKTVAGDSYSFDA